MAYWLLKTEPSEYSFEDLVKEGKTKWTGISNPVALKNLRAMKAGDGLLIYHTGKEKAVVGTGKVLKVADGEPPVIQVQAGKRLTKPVTLAEIKGDKRFAGWDLVRIGRLS